MTLKIRIVRKVIQRLNERYPYLMREAVVPKGSHIHLNPRKRDDYYVDCTNPECGWSGLQSQTVQVGGDNAEDSCPKCHFIAEPADRR